MDREHRVSGPPRAQEEWSRGKCGSAAGSRQERESRGRMVGLPGSRIGEAKLGPPFNGATV